MILKLLTLKDEASVRNYGLSPAEIIGKSVNDLGAQGYYRPVIAPLVLIDDYTAREYAKIPRPGDLAGQVFFYFNKLIIKRFSQSLENYKKYYIIINKISLYYELINIVYVIFRVF